MNNIKNKFRNISRKKLLLVIILIIVMLFVLAFLVAGIGYRICFQRANIPENSIFLSYKDVDSSKYPRREEHFISADNKLAAYIYGNENKKGLVVISHGLGSGADSYFSETLYFVDNGWRVFTYNNTGSHTSEGKNTKGISQSLLDLKAALDFIANDPDLKELPVVLYGHSWGGYAVTSVLNYDYQISAVVSVAGFSTPQEALFDFAQNRTGIFGIAGFPFFWAYHNILFKENANISAISGINKTEIPIMIIHGSNDGTLRYNVSGIISHEKNIFNPNVTLISRDEEFQNGHSNLMFSKRAVIYAAECKEKWDKLNTEYKGKIPADVKEKYYNEANHFLSSELDAELFSQINIVFNNAITD